MAWDKAHYEVFVVPQKLAVEADVAPLSVVGDDHGGRHVASGVLWPVVRDGQGAEFRCLAADLEHFGLVLGDHDGILWVGHGPAEGVDVRARLDANRFAQTVAGQHVHRSPVARSLFEGLEHRHGACVGVGPAPKAVHEADGFGYRGGRTEVVPERHEASSRRQGFNVTDE